jgi:hypothetical protein
LRAILVNRKPVGALGVDPIYRRDYNRATSFSIIAIMIAQAIKGCLIETDKKPVDARIPTKQELRELRL